MSTNLDAANKEDLAKAIGKLSSGVYIVTLGSAEQKQGMLATWIIQAAFEPPMLSMAVQKKREILSQLSKGSKFCVNTLSKKNMDIFKAFARPFKEGEDRFAELKLSDRSVVAPVFAEAISYMEGTVSQLIEAGDHMLLLAEITGGCQLNEDEPMLHTRKNGFQY